MRISSNSHINHNLCSLPVKNNAGNISAAPSFKGSDNSFYFNSLSGQGFNFIPGKDKTRNLGAFINELQNIFLKKDIYSDLDLFSRYFEAKIKKMMKVPTEDSIINDVFEISAVTKTDEFDVCAVMSELTSFASWNSLDALEKSAINSGCGKPYDIFHGDKIASKDFSLCEKEGYLSVNDVLNYITENKHLMSFDETAEPCLYIDDFQLDEIEKVKENMPKLFEKLSDKVSDGSVKLAVINGWNAKACGKNVSQTFLGSSTDLKSATISVIKEMKKTGKSLNEVLNGNTYYRLKNIFGDDVHYTLLNNHNGRDYCPGLVQKNLSSRYPSANQIKAVIETISEDMVYSDDTQHNIKSLLARYFDNMTVCFSEKTVNEEMKKKHFEISQILKRQGKTEDDAVYIIPTKGKSFELMTYQYAKVNGIKPSQIYYYNGLNPVMKRFGKNIPDLNNKTLVILDDIIGTGVSMCGGSFKYERFSKSQLENTDIIFSSLAALPEGAERINSYGSLFKRPNDVLLPGKITDYDNFLAGSGITTYSDKEFFEKACGSGFHSGFASVAFPYMLPDNNSNAAGLMLSFCLADNNRHSNKSGELYRRYIDRVNEKTEQFAQKSVLS